VRDATFITLTQGFATHQDGNRVFKQAGFEPKVAMQVNDIFTLLSMVSSGVGYALLPGRIAAVYENRVKLIPLQKVPVAAAHRRGVPEGQGARPESAGVAGRVSDVCQSPGAGLRHRYREQAPPTRGMHSNCGRGLRWRQTYQPKSKRQPTSPRTMKNNSEGPSRQPSPVWNVAVNAP
jgi:hypothetical protein